MISEEIAGAFCLWLLSIYVLICSIEIIINGIKIKDYVSIIIFIVLNIVLNVFIIYVTGLWFGWWGNYTQVQ